VDEYQDYKNFKNYMVENSESFFNVAPSTKYYFTNTTICTKSYTYTKKKFTGTTSIMWRLLVSINGI
jgi:hypothetical protein